MGASAASAASLEVSLPLPATTFRSFNQNACVSPSDMVQYKNLQTANKQQAMAFAPDADCAVEIIDENPALLKR